MDTSGAAVEHDVVVIGSGVAGALIANSLAQAGMRVLILEAGGPTQRSESVARYRAAWTRDPASAYVRTEHAPHPDPNTPNHYLRSIGPDPYRVSYLRQSGGTTWHWTGITPRFLPADFEIRSRFGVGRDWPISYADLEPFYLRAEYELGVSGDQDHGSPRSGAYPMPGLAMPYSDQVIAKRLRPHGLEVSVLPAARNSQVYDNRPPCCGNNTCTPICPIGAQYSADIHVRRAVANGARIIHDAVASFIHVDAGGNVDRIEYKRPDGSTEAVRGRQYVVACNGIETPKLLLLSRTERLPSGVANRSGHVGVGLMDHPTMAVDFLMPEPLYTGRGPQVVSSIDIGRDGKFRAAHAAGKFFILNSHDAQQLVTDLIEKQQSWANLNEDFIHISSHYGFIGIELEQLPSPENRITVSSTDVDGLGIPKPEVHMHFDEYLHAAERTFRVKLDKILNHLGAEKRRDYPIGTLWPNHPMGTAFMGNDARSSVVDRNCKAHDHGNLYLAGSSVFSTGGTANPTLTLAALSLRLADYLAAQSGRIKAAV